VHDPSAFAQLARDIQSDRFTSLFFANNGRADRRVFATDRDVVVNDATGASSSSTVDEVHIQAGVVAAIRASRQRRDLLSLEYTRVLPPAVARAVTAETTVRHALRVLVPMLYVDAHADADRYHTTLPALDLLLAGAGYARRLSIEHVRLNGSLADHVTHLSASARTPAYSSDRLAASAHGHTQFDGTSTPLVIVTYAVSDGVDLTADDEIPVGQRPLAARFTMSIVAHNVAAAATAAAAVEGDEQSPSAIGELCIRTFFISPHPNAAAGS
jgi:hypothetical protein